MQALAFHGQEFLPFLAVCLLVFDTLKAASS